MYDLLNILRCSVSSVCSVLNFAKKFDVLNLVCLNTLLAKFVFDQQFKHIQHCTKVSHTLFFQVAFNFSCLMLFSSFLAVSHVDHL